MAGVVGGLTAPTTDVCVLTLALGRGRLYGKGGLRLLIS